MDDPRNNPSPRVTMPESVILGQKVRTAGENDPSRPTFHDATNMDRSATCNFLSAIHSNHGAISYTVSDINGDLGQKLQIFPPQLYITTLLRGSRWYFVMVVGLKKDNGDD